MPLAKPLPREVSSGGLEDASAVELFAAEFSAVEFLTSFAFSGHGRVIRGQVTCGRVIRGRVVGGRVIRGRVICGQVLRFPSARDLRGV